MARLLAVPVGAISHGISTGAQLCTAVRLIAFAPRRDAGVEVLANVEWSGGRAYFVSSGRSTKTRSTGRRPRREPAAGRSQDLGLLASNWFPDEQWLMSTDGHSVITVSVEWSRRGPQPQDRARARGRRFPYLHTPHGKLAQRLAQTLP